MSASLPLVGGALVGVVAGSLLVPVTRRELAAAVVRSSAASNDAAPIEVPASEQQLKGWHWATLALLSGLLPAYVLHGVGWSLNALPPLLLVVGLVQLSYCDVTRRLLPKTLVHGLTVVVVASGIAVAADVHEWDRLKIALDWGLDLLRHVPRHQLDQPALDGLRRRPALLSRRFRARLG